MGGGGQAPGCRAGRDMIAGPTEVMVIADSTARSVMWQPTCWPRLSMMRTPTAWCVTTDLRLAEALPAALEQALAASPRAAVARFPDPERSHHLGAVDRRRPGRQPPGAGASRDSDPGPGVARGPACEAPSFLRPDSPERWEHRRPESCCRPRHGTVASRSGVRFRQAHQLDPIHRYGCSMMPTR